MSRDYINPPELSRPMGYTHVVRARGSQMIYLAGQVAFDPTGNMIGRGDLRAQAIQVFENLKAALAAVDASFGDVVKMTTYIVNYTPEMRAAIRDVRNLYVSAERPPANTLIGVQALAVEGLLIEIEAVAIVD
jgi:enamine deaminase RidA (YjgF/YER057c/UK114 family)